MPDLKVEVRRAFNHLNGSAFRQGEAPPQRGSPRDWILLNEEMEIP
jgi:hypothetical protein